MSPYVQEMDTLKAELDITTSRKKTIENRLNLSRNQLEEAENGIERTKYDLDKKNDEITNIKKLFQELSNSTETLTNNIKVIITFKTYNT